MAFSQYATKRRAKQGVPGERKESSGEVRAVPCAPHGHARGRSCYTEAEAEVRVPREPGYGYVCWCTKKKGQ